ncbi:hypothetical protein [Mesorhizobium sp. M4B.F.Ca.ET.200.01.1.1]|uniref:hypothetical protein n=1 Tax=Mesorhizobium sp. M4B.F.Ca.ET.200.01.1.1 TaxID=2563952 RepID=UPI00167A52B9|nr:hypothetical protein [Mesorhizobium sp. M4B.F.Ca.ET.200.01.1.1]
MIDTGIAEQDAAQPREFRQQVYGWVAQIGSRDFDAGLVTGVEVHNARTKLPWFSH